MPTRQRQVITIDEREPADRFGDRCRVTPAETHRPGRRRSSTGTIVRTDGPSVPVNSSVKVRGGRRDRAEVGLADLVGVGVGHPMPSGVMIVTKSIGVAAMIHFGDTAEGSVAASRPRRPTPRPAGVTRRGSRRRRASPPQPPLASARCASETRSTDQNGDDHDYATRSTTNTREAARAGLSRPSIAVIAEPAYRWRPIRPQMGAVRQSRP